MHTMHAAGIERVQALTAVLERVPGRVERRWASKTLSRAAVDGVSQTSECEA